jgi:hypothetical protein
VESSSYVYAYAVILEGGLLFLLWRDGGDSADEVLVQTDGTIPLFDTEKAAREAASQSERFSEQPVGPPLDLDAARSWCKTPTDTTVDASLVLGAWNLFADVEAIRNEPKFRALDRDADRSYDKLYFGCNLPAVTPDGKAYEPQWSDAEVTQLRTLLTAGFDLFDRRVRRWPSN